MKITDNTRTVEIQMMIWQGNGYSPDWSNDFFDAGLLPYNEQTEIFTVEDLDYCIEHAQEWADEDDNNRVFIEEIA